MRRHLQIFWRLVVHLTTLLVVSANSSCQGSSRPPTRRYPINFRKNQFCTDLYHLFQSTDKKWFMDESTDFSYSVPLLTPPPPDPIALSRIAVFYGQTTDLWTNLRIFSYSVRLLPPPPGHIALHAPSQLFSAATPPPRSASEISGFFAIPIGQPCQYDPWRYMRAICGKWQCSISVIHSHNVCSATWTKKVKWRRALRLAGQRRCSVWNVGWLSTRMILWHKRADKRVSRIRPYNSYIGWKIQTNTTIQDCD